MSNVKEGSSYFAGDVARPKLEDYAEKYKHILALERQDGILEARFHSNGGVMGSTGWFNVWSQAWWEIGNDPDNEVIIITATGDQWIHYPGPPDGEITEEMRVATASAAGARTSPANAFRLYFDCMKNIENVIFGLNVPTIGAIQGPAFVHYDTALLCDLTICTEGSFFKEPHADFGLAPGDGLGMAMQHLLNAKQQAYYLYTSETMDAQTALRLGLVNEVVPQDALMVRARAIAKTIMRMPKLARLMTKQIVRRRLKQRYVQDAEFHIAHELVGILSNIPDRSAHTPEHVRDSLQAFARDSGLG